VTPVVAGRPPATRPAGTSVHSRAALSGWGLGMAATARRPRRPGVHGNGQQGHRRTYRPTVDTPDTPPISSPPGPRFLTLNQVGEELQVTRSQVYALVRDKSLAAVKIGGPGQWRVERCRLEEYIAELYRDAEWYGSNDLAPSGRETIEVDQPTD